MLLKKDGGRSCYIDTLKGIAIILVVIGHSIQMGSGADFLEKQLYYENWVFKIIYSFHMPFFMLISGYLFKISLSKYSVKQIILNRFRTLLLPVFSLTVVKWCSQFFLNGKGSLRSFCRTFINTGWFLWAILLLSFAVLAVHKIFNDSIMVYFLCFIVTFFIPDFICPAVYKYMYPYFVGGYFFHKYELQDKVTGEKIVKKIILISGSCFVVLLPFYRVEAYIYTSGYSILKEEMVLQLGIDLYRMIIGFAGSIFVMALLYKVQVVCSWLLMIGKSSLGIYVISDYIHNYIQPVLTKNNEGTYIHTYIHTYIQAFVILMICMFITLALRKNRLTNLFFLGGR